MPGVEVYNLESFKVGAGRFAHAKCIIAKSSSADHVLFGSANCTVAALGVEGRRGDNDEACLYRKLPPDTVLESLDLNSSLTDENLLSIDELPDQQLSESMPLEELERSNIGEFWCSYNKLVWRPSGSDLKGFQVIHFNTRHIF